MLDACYQRTAARYYVLDPYQIGHGNAEAIASGAFWFYRKLGFRSMDEAARQLTAREERRIAAQPGYRSPAHVLRRLVRHPMVFEIPGATPGFWDGFSVRSLGLRIARARPGALSRAKEQLRRGRRDPRILRTFRDAGQGAA